VSWQELVVYLVVGLAVLYVLRRFLGKRRPKPSKKPDVPLSRLTRKKKD
jgi:multisubunit Na+/H+ antiporter MnhE subunit